MNLSALIPLVAAACNLVVTLFVVSRGLRSGVKRVYCAWGLSLVVWNFGTFCLFVVKDRDAALFWARFLQFGVMFGTVSLFHLSLMIAQVPVGRAIKWLYGFCGVLAVSNFTAFYIRDVRNVGYAWYSVAGPGFYLFSLAYSLCFVSILILLRKRRTLPPLHRRRLDYLILAQTILVTLGANDILPILGVDHYPFTAFRIFPFGSMAAIFYGIIVSYSVLQHQLLDIHVSLGKIAANLVRVTFLFFFGLLLLLGVVFFAPPGQFPLFAFVASLGVLLVSTVVAAVYFPRLFGAGDDRIERTLLGDRFEYHAKVQGFTDSIQSYTDAGLLMRDLHALLVNTVGVRTYHIILLDETARVFAIYRSHPEQGTVLFPDMHTDSPVFRFFRGSGAPYLPLNMVYSIPEETDLERAAREQLQRFSAEFCFPFVVDQDLFGLMLIGEKTSGDRFTPHDLRLLTDLVQSLGLLLNQIRLKKKVLLAEELDLLGRMSRGMAHDLNNLLTPVKTVLQLEKDGLMTPDAVAQLLPVALRNLGTMESYIREALFFSQHRTPRIEEGRLDLVVQKAIDTAEGKLSSKEIRVVYKPEEAATIEMDAVLIQRLIANLLSNAVDASPRGSTVQVGVQKLAKTEASRDWHRIRVVDEGEGISAEHLGRIVKGYFTTKDKGDENRGFGLGLSICRQIVHLHGGNMNIASQEGRGTTVYIDLPSRQAKRLSNDQLARPAHA